MHDNRNIFRTMNGNAYVRYCAHCRTDENATWSEHDQCYLCDDCFTELHELEWSDE